MFSIAVTEYHKTEIFIRWTHCPGPHDSMAKSRASKLHRRDREELACSHSDNPNPTELSAQSLPQVGVSLCLKTPSPLTTSTTCCVEQLMNMSSVLGGQSTIKPYHTGLSATRGQVCLLTVTAEGSVLFYPILKKNIASVCKTYATCTRGGQSDMNRCFTM